MALLASCGGNSNNSQSAETQSAENTECATATEPEAPKSADIDRAKATEAWNKAAEAEQTKAEPIEQYCMVALEGNGQMYYIVQNSYGMNKVILSPSYEVIVSNFGGPLEISTRKGWINVDIAQGMFMESTYYRLSDGKVQEIWISNDERVTVRKSFTDQNPRVSSEDELFKQMDGTPVIEIADADWKKF